MGLNPAADRMVGERAGRIRRNVGWFAVGLGAAGLLAGLLVAPPDAVQGNAQRLMYLHVPAAWTAYLAFAVVLVASVAYLVTGKPSWDRRALAAAEVGVGLTALTIALGSLWGRVVWGVWWVWDPRLVSTALLLVCYVGYLLVRRPDAPAARNARRAAWLGIAGFALVPVVHFSVVWWRSVHQPATLLAPRINPPIDLLMATALVLGVGAFTAAAAWVFLRRLAVLSERPNEPSHPSGANGQRPARTGVSGGIR